MTNRERMRAIFGGGRPDRVPFMPFAELMPDCSFTRELAGRGMGLIAHASSVRSEVREVETTEVCSGGKRTITCHTPYGAVSSVYDTTKKKITGNSLGVQTGFMIQGPGDYDAVIHIIDNTVFYRDPAGYDAAADALGENGILHCWTDEPPYMGAQYYLGLEAWSFHQFDYPEAFQKLLDALERRQERLLTLLLDGPDSLVNLGNLAGNFGPEPFEKYMLPYFKKYVPKFRERGKITTLHADANNLNAFRELVAETGIDVVEAFTPPPFGDLPLAEARKAWGEKVTLWINFPESVFYGGYEQTRRHAVDLLRSDPCGNKFIGLTEMGLLGVDETNRGMFEDGIRAVMDAIDEAGGYPAG